jgi:Tol biopolymer transport system component
MEVRAMDDLRDLITQAVRHVRAGPEDLEQTLRLVRARQRNRRLAAATSALLVAAGGVGLAWWAFGSMEQRTAATPAPERIVFTTQGPDDMVPLITVMDVDGSDVRVLGPGLEPAWSPDGSMIAFSAPEPGPEQSAAIFVMNADGSDIRQLTDSPKGTFDEGPSWSPDGSRIVFSRNPVDLSGVDPLPAGNSRRDLYTVSVDGTDLTKLVGGPTDDFGPDWSPDGSRITFARFVDPTSDGPDSLPQIWTIAQDGTDAIQLTRSGRSAQDPAWSPDGSILSFSDGGSDIYLIGADGEGLHRLKIPSGWGEEAESPYGASWSPNGTRLAFSAGGELGLDVFVVDLDGSNLQRLTSPGTNDASPSWGVPLDDNVVDRSPTDAPSTPAPSPRGSRPARSWSRTLCCPRPSKPKAFRRAGWWQSGSRSRSFSPLSDDLIGHLLAGLPPGSTVRIVPRTVHSRTRLMLAGQTRPAPVTTGT